MCECLLFVNALFSFFIYSFTQFSFCEKSVTMKALSKNILLILLPFLWGGMASAQIFQIQNPGIRDVPPGHNHNSHFAFQFKIKNVSGQSYTGPLISLVEVIGGGVRRIDSAYTTSTGNGNNFTIFVDSFVVDTPFFNYGRNGIVVWVVDDNLNPISDYDSTELYVTDQPSFLLGESGLRQFDPVVDTALYYDFKLRVVNAFNEDFEDTLFLNLQTEEGYFRLPSENTVLIRANKHSDFYVRDFKYPAPPFWKGINPMRLWVDGTGTSPSLDTVEVDVELINGPEQAPGGGGGTVPTSIGIMSPTNGPVVISPPASTTVQAVELWDMQGKRVLVHKGSGDLDLSQLPQFTEGLYWLNVQLSDGSQQQSKLLFVR